MSPKSAVCVGKGDRMSRLQTLSDAEWDLIEDFMPSSDGRRGRRFSDHRLVVEGIIYRYRTGVAWRDLPAEFGPWQTVWKRHRRFAGDGTWDKVLTALLTRADTMGVIDWDVAVDSTIARAHQHATNTRRLAGGSIELHDADARAGRSCDRAIAWRSVDEGPSAVRRQGTSHGHRRRAGPRQRLEDVPAPARCGSGPARRGGAASHHP